MTDGPAPLAPSPVASVAASWRARVRATPGALAFEFRRDGAWTRSTWTESDREVRRLAAGLIADGVPRGARIAILAKTRVEWVWIDYAILCAGAATSTIYPSSTAADARYVLEDAGCWAVFVEDRDQLAKIAGAGVRAYLLDGDAPGTDGGTDAGDVDTVAALAARGAVHLRAHPHAVDERIDAIGPDDVATLIYTSGTTGPPKGVVLAHGNWLFQAEAMRATVGRTLRPGDEQYLFLPLAHSFGKACELVAVELGVPTAIDGDLDAILAGLQHVKPTMVPAVPRVFEKIHNRIVTAAKQAGPRRYAVFRWAVGVGDEVVTRRMAGERVGVRLRAKHAVADRLVYRRLRAALGGRIRAFGSGGAPLSPEIARFFLAAGITIVEGYGLTETAAAAVVNRLDDFRFGTVGRPIPGCEVRVADDGELWLRGPNVMRGYWNRPDATADVLDADGWLHTGDLGAVDAEGRVRITGRKKDLIVTSGGKNVAPQDIEHAIKGRCPLVSEVVMLGDARPFCVALVWLDPDAAAAHAIGLGLAGGPDGADYGVVARHPAVAAEVQAAVDAVNATLPPYATIKRIHLADDGPITQASGLLTPSLKVKRSAVAARYAAVLDRFYAGTVVAV
ncbi:MAG: long-chain fatty acid--CoA ligase [Myxococcota bacterium]